MNLDYPDLPASPLLQHVETVLRGYYKTTSDLCSALNIFSDFDLQLHGFGFDSSGIFFALSAGRTEKLRAVQGYGSRAVYVHKHMFVSATTKPPAQTSDELGFSCVMVPNTNGCVRVSIPAELSQQLKQSSSDLLFPITQSLVKEDKGDLCLHSGTFQKELEKYTGNLAILHPNILCAVCVAGSDSVTVETAPPQRPGELMQGVESSGSLLNRGWPPCAQALLTRELMQGVESVGALLYWGWPPCAQAYLTRARAGNWPPLRLIQNVSQSAVYLVPAISHSPATSAHTGDRRPKTDTDSAVLWRYSFVEAERQLFSHAGPAVQRVFIALLQLCSTLSPMCGCQQYERSLVPTLKHLVLWAVEKGLISVSPPEPGRKQTLTSAFGGMLRSLLRHLQACLDADFLPNYFIEETNLLQDVVPARRLINLLAEVAGEDTGSELEELLSLVSAEKRLQEITAALSPEQTHQFYSQLREKSFHKVESVFTDLYKLVHLTFYSNLHRGGTVPRCLELHELAQRHLASKVRTRAGSSASAESSPAQRRNSLLLEWASRLVASSQASLYLVSAQRAPPTPKSRQKIARNLARFSPQRSVPGSERTFYQQKAEELFLLSNNVDLLSGRVRLAVFLLLTARLHEALDLLRDVISATGGNEADIISATGEIEADASLHSVSPYTSLLLDEREARSGVVQSSISGDVAVEAICDQLLQPILARDCILDLLFSEHEAAILPEVIRQDLKHTTAVFLGVQRVDIYVLDPELILRMLKVLTLTEIMQESSQRRAKAAPPLEEIGIFLRRLLGGGELERAEVSERELSPRVTAALGATNSPLTSVSHLFRLALSELEKLEALCGKDQRDLNERRNMAYFNMLAACYLLLANPSKTAARAPTSTNTAANEGIEVTETGSGVAGRSVTESSGTESHITGSYLAGSGGTRSDGTGISVIKSSGTGSAVAGSYFAGSEGTGRYFTGSSDEALCEWCRGRALELWEHSIAIAPNPMRNPAVMRRVALRNKDTGSRIKTGLVVALGIGVMAAVVGIARAWSS